MKFRFSYLTFPLGVLAVAYVGGLFTSVGIESGWYGTLAKPSWTPPGGVIGLVWTALYVMVAVSFVVSWNARRKGRRRVAIAATVNGLLNAGWSLVFFALGSPGGALLVIVALVASIVGLIRDFRSRSKLAAWLLVPYLCWVCFAGLLNFAIWCLN